MAYTVGFILFAAEEADQVREVLFPEEFARGEVLVRIVEPGGYLKAAEELVGEGAQALITRGGSYHNLREHGAGVPLVELAIGTQDIIYALSKVIDKYDRIWLIVSEWVNFNYERCRSLLPEKVRFFRFTQIGDMLDFMDNIEADERTLIVGGGFTLAPAAARGLNALQLRSSADSLREAYQNALNILRETDREAARAQQLETILANIEDGVVVLDGDWRVTLCNRKAEELLGMSSRRLIGQELTLLLPQFAPVWQAYRRGKRSDQLVRVQHRDLSMKAAPIAEISNDVPSGGTLITIRDVTKLQELETNLRFQMSRRGLTAKYHFEDILTRDPAMLRLIKWARECAESDSTVMIYGESGTGKELFAQSIHNASSRRNHPFVAVNCAALTESLLESELFGYVGGAFTGARKDGKAGLFELAHRGTLFLDEVNSMSKSTQAKILRVIEQREVMRLGSDYVIPLDVRIITAANEDLDRMVRQESFRRDLFFRLNVLELRIPTLNDRPADIPYLFRHFVAELEGVQEDSVKLDEKLEAALSAHQWRGNIRELRNAAQRYVVLGGVDIFPSLTPEAPGRVAENLVGDDLKIDLKELSRTVEGLVIQSLLDRGLTKTQTAKALGISRTALFKKLENQKGD